MKTTPTPTPATQAQPSACALKILAELREYVGFTRESIGMDKTFAEIIDRHTNLPALEARLRVMEAALREYACAKRGPDGTITAIKLNAAFVKRCPVCRYKPIKD